MGEAELLGDYTSGVLPPCPPLAYDAAPVCDWIVETNLTCGEFDPAAERARFRQELLEAALQSAESWASTSVSLSLAAIVIDSILILLLLLPNVQRQRPVQAAGLGHMNLILAGCVTGHIATMLDGYNDISTSPVWCRGRLVFIYIFLRCRCLGL